MSGQNNGSNGSNLPPPPPGGNIIRFLKELEVCDRTTLGRATIWRKVKAGTFPAPRQLADGRVGWYEHEVDAWIMEPVV